jgi:hypothetical protein
MATPNNFGKEFFAMEAVKEAGSDIRPSALADFLDDFKAGLFNVETAAEHVASCRLNRPHRFVAKGDDAEALARKAFLDGNITAAGRYLTLYGEADATQLR